ncbi:porin family protein [Stenoxybacter acetivorans]|uniref:porin family protein n=1 Tax=Stenoxybacter acetivorans TaxID=422441 RepID=UPI00068D6979|nr:porin family protein [Stenoxybacter acetivorans]
MKFPYCTLSFLVVFGFGKASGESLPNTALPQNNLNITAPQQSELFPAAETGDDEEKEVNISLEELQKNPLLLQHALDSSVATQNIAAVQMLLPPYQAQENHDVLLVWYAQALLAKAENRYADAIAYYRKILAENPDLTPTRLALAEALFTNGQLQAAQDQFNKIKAAPDLPLLGADAVKQYEEILAKQTEWSINASVRYLSDNNVNNAPKQRYLPTDYGVWTFPKPQSAHGIGYQVNAQKDTLVKDHVYWRIGTDVYGKFYWDNHDYDDVQARFTLGPVYKSARQEWAVQPFYGYRWFGTLPYSHTLGMRVQGTYLISGRWQALGALEYGRDVYIDRPFLTGTNLSISTSVVYRQSAKQYWLVGLDVGRNGAEDLSEAYRYYGARFAWGNEWPKSISTSIQFGWWNKHYQEEDFFYIRRNENSLFATASVWNRAWQWHGLTPKLTFQYNRVYSNDVFYQYDKKQLYLDFSKTF